MLRAALIAAASLIAIGAHAQTAPAVYPGCAIPPTTFANVWTFDPVTGDDLKGTGSATAPWKTVQSLTAPGAWGGPRLSTVPYWHAAPGSGWVWATNAAATVRPGDAVQLASGNHGAFNIGVWKQAIENGGDWITVMPAPGASPVLASLSIYGTGNWRFTGLKVQGIQPAGSTSAGSTPLIKVFGAGLPSTTHDIVFDHLTVNSNDTPNFAPDLDTFNTTTMTGIWMDDQPGVNCVSITHSHFFNLMFGVTGTTAQTLIDHDEIDHVGADGVDVNSGQVAITSNYLHDMQSTFVAHWHPDFIQGQNYAHGTPPGDGIFHHLVIDSNRMIRVVDPALSPIGAWVQGIDAYDGQWSDVLITRNVVATSACWGISWGATTGMLIAQNTVVFDGWLPGVSTAAGVRYCLPTFAPLTATHQAPLGDHVVAVNNIAPAGGYGVSPAGSVVTNNLITSGPWSFSTPKVAGPPAVSFVGKAGVYGGNRLLGVEPPAGIFVSMGRESRFGESCDDGDGRSREAARPFDGHLMSALPSVSAGTRTIPAPGDLSDYPDLVLPLVDIEGTPYSATAPSLGAYAYKPVRGCTTAPR